ncbi:ABC transporter ATP-binding protein/permease [Homoserinimonas sp. OAct 916]|uniref:ABC transporter ATP-binding protein/permease n=1 Tax=Homoserinimonas sp. OAct 916 TaxID=2211450 RepID=UPI001E63B239|nr:ABC transporter ATP-binding protein/permease [Homoserinimonas sp. OAct 916]
MRPLDPRLLTHATAARSFLALGAVLGLAQTVTIVAFCWLLSSVISSAIDGQPLGRLAQQVGALAAVVIVRSVLIWLVEVTATRGAARVKSQLRTLVLSRVGELGPDWLAGRRSVRVTTVISTGLDALDDYFGRYLPQLLLTVIATPILVAAMFWLDVPSGVTVIIALPLIPIFMMLIGWRTQAVQQRSWESLQTLSTAFLDLVGGLSTLKIFGRERRQFDRVRRVTDDYRVETMRVLRVTFLSGFALELAASLSVALVAVSVGLRMLDGQLSLAVGLFVLLLAPEAFAPLRQVGAQFHAAADGVAAAEEVFQILEEQPAAQQRDASASLVEESEVRELSRNRGVGLVPRVEGSDGGGSSRNPLQSVRGFETVAARPLSQRKGASSRVEVRGSSRNRGVGSFPRVEGSEVRGSSRNRGVGVFPRVEGSDGGGSSRNPRALLRVEQLTVTRGTHRVLDRLNAEFAPGQITVVSGPSGCGKSTLIGALLGFTPYGGRITLAGHEITPTDDRAWLSWAGQRPGLMTGTVAENVALGDPADEFDSALVAWSLEAAAAGELDGSEMLGVNGAGLSGGQAQRVAVARALYRSQRHDCAVVALDEPSSALDADAEQKLIHGLRLLADQGRTVIVVSHRPALLDAADTELRMGERAYV